MSRSRRLFGAAMGVLFACAMLHSAHAQNSAPPQRSPSAARFEANLRHEYDEMERRLRRSGIRNQDGELNAFVQRLGCTIAQERCSELRFYVVESAEFNASMAPNGMMLINSGLLLRLETEAQLSFVMGHEFGHYMLDHVMERVEAFREAQATGLILSAVLGMAGAGSLASLGYLPAAAGAMEFSRDQEEEADVFAAEIARGRGLDAHAGAQAWRDLSAEIAASSNEETRRRLTRRSMFATHPLTTDRVAYLEALPNDHPGSGNDKAAYRAIIRPHLRRWLQAEISDRDGGATLALIDRLAQQNEDMGVLHFMRGEIYRFRNGEADAGLALAAYTAAAQAPDAPAESWRQIGVMQERLQNTAGAVEAYRHYLELAPDAPDRALIENVVTTLGGAAQ